MDVSEGEKRIRKPISYAILQNSDDDDFSEFTPPVKKNKDDKDITKKLDTTLNNQIKNSQEKEKSSSSSSQSSTNGRDREKSRDKEKDGKRKDRDREKRDKDRDKDGDRHRSKNKHRDKDRERSKDSREKHSSEKEKHKHKKDKKYDRSERKDEQKVKEKVIIDVEDIDPDFKECLRSPRAGNPPLTSTQKSPGRTIPKPRLTVEERMFQRELEAALAISKVETKDETKDSADDQGLPEEKLEADIEVAENGHSSPCNPNPVSMCKSPDRNRIESQNSSNQDTKTEPPKPELSKEEAANVPIVIDENGSNSGIIQSDVNTDLNVKQEVKSEAVTKVSDERFEDPQPSTSTGRTSKRQRKTVVFAEDSDSDSFAGFEGSGMSEESDFAPSPVKKKGKPTKESKKIKSPKPSKSQSKSPSVSKSPKRAASRSKGTAASSSKENTAPASVSSSSPIVDSPSVPRVPPLIISRVPPPSVSRVPLAKPIEKPRITSNNRTTASGSSESAAATRIGLVKVPFRSPIVQGSNASTPNFVPQSPNTLRRIGVRLGLSRSNIRPLHPGATSK